MVQKGWLFLLKKYPAIIAPFTAWMIFGGAIFGYNYFIADKVSIGDVKTFGELVTPSTETPIELSLMPQAYAGPRGEKIMIDGKETGYYYNPRYVAYVTPDGQIFIYDKSTRKGGVPFKLDYPVDYYFEQARKK